MKVMKKHVPNAGSCCFTAYMHVSQGQNCDLSSAVPGSFLLGTEPASFVLVAVRVLN